MGLHPGTVLVCEHEFLPEMPDELYIAPGHRIWIIENVVRIICYHLVPTTKMLCFSNGCLIGPLSIQQNVSRHVFYFKL